MTALENYRIHGDEAEEQCERGNGTFVNRPRSVRAVRRTRPGLEVSCRLSTRPPTGSR